MPYVVRPFGCDDPWHFFGSDLLGRSLGRLGRRLLGLQHPSDGRDAEVQAGPGEHLGDLDLAQGRAEPLELLDDVPVSRR